MTKGKKLLLAVVIGGLLGAQLVFTIMLWKPDGIRIAWPEAGAKSGRSFPVAGDAWMAPGAGAIDRIAVVARPVDPAAAEPVRVEAKAQWVKDRGRPLYPLHLWSAPIALPVEGAWTITATAFSKDGRSVASKPRSFTCAAVPPREFRPWSPEHMIAFGLGLSLIAAVSVAAAMGGERFMRRFAPWYTVIALGNEIAFHFYWFLSDAWTVQNNLMLHMCSVAILLLPVVMMMERGRLRDFMCEILYFWGTGGAIQALIFPDVGANGFPTYRFISFFLSHSLIIAGSMSLAASGRVRITIGSLGRHYLFTTLAMVPIYFIDRIFALIPPYAPANYFLLGFPPPMGSIVDLFAQVFGPSPWYALGFEVMGIGVFGILWLPWAVGRKVRKATVRSAWRARDAERRLARDATA